MKRIFCLGLVLLLAHQLGAWGLNLVRIPAPANPAVLEQTGFQLLSCSGQYWIGLTPEGAVLPERSVILDTYNPAAGEYYQLSFPSAKEASLLSGKARVLLLDGNIAIVQLSEAQLYSLPAMKAQWKRISSPAWPTGYYGRKVREIDQFHPLVYEFVSLIDSATYRGYIQTLEDFVTRNTRTTIILQATQWIQQQFTSFGLTTSLDPFIISGLTRYNVVGELIGETYPDEIVLITGHFDATAGQPSVAEPIAPGADDNASGAAAVIECARILSQYSFDRTLRFVTFAGEEQGLYGSEDYVQGLVAAGANVVGCFNYDMIAYSGNDPRPPDMIIYSDNNPLSQAMADKLTEASMTFVPNQVEPVLIIDPSMVYSDHAPFWDAGYPALLSIEEEAWGPDFNPYYHSVQDLLINCDVSYAVACSKAAIAALADYAGPIVTSGPALMVSNYTLMEIIGNGNGLPDPDELFWADLTLTNVGVTPAVNVSVWLMSNDPMINVGQAFSLYPDIQPGDSAVCLNSFGFYISPICPPNYTALLEVDIYLDTTLSFYSSIDFIVSDPVYQPLGPDAYGYYAFDILDENGPVYDWVEIDPAMGGAGTPIIFTADDQTVQVNLPFTFSYYGQSYTQASVCSNGWMAMGVTTSTDHSNSHIPDPDGPPAMMAPFWEDLSPQQAGTVCYYYDAAEHTFILEFNAVRQYSPTWARETFEVILYDPAYYATPTGDGKILFQFKDIADPSSCTVGIENQAETIGLECWYNGSHPAQVLPIANETAILFTTITGYPNVTITLTPAVTPVQIPAGGGTFGFNIAVHNAEAATQFLNVWCDITLPSGAQYGPVLGPANVNLGSGSTINRDRNQTIPAGAPAGDYIYHGYTGLYPNVVWSEDSFPFTKLTTGDGGFFADWNNWGEAFDGETADADISLPQEFKLFAPYPNPFNSSTVITFNLPAAGEIKLAVYDVLGREVQELRIGNWELGKHTVVWEAENQASGIYFIRLQTPELLQTQKVVLMK